MLAPISRGPLSECSASRLSHQRGTPSGNRAKPLGAPAYEHPQRYLIFGEPANANPVVLTAESPRPRCARRLVENVNDHASAAAGIDWAKDEHALCIIEASGRKIVLEGRYAHDERGINELCLTLVKMGVERLAIERPEGVLVERLLECGLTVLAIHPNQLKASRPRFRASGYRSKSDSFDAFCLAELARTDHHRFRVLTPDSDETKALKVLTRAREDLVGTRVALANQLRAELEAFWGGAALLHSQRSTLQSRWLFWSVIRVPRTPQGSERSVLGAFSQTTATAGARAPPNC